MLTTPTHAPAALQVLWSAFFGSHSLLPSLLALGAGCAAVALDSAGRLPPALQNVWGALSAWTATLLFMLQPVSQLVSNFRVRRGGAGGAGGQEASGWASEHVCEGAAGWRRWHAPWQGWPVRCGATSVFGTSLAGMARPPGSGILRLEKAHHMGVPSMHGPAAHARPAPPHCHHPPQDPASLAGLSLATIQLAAAGNALMVPRALFTRDVTWLVGSFWGSTVFGWAQMLSMWLGRAPATGARYCTTPHFAAVSALLWGWFAVVAWVDARAKRGSGTAQAELAAAAEE